MTCVSDITFVILFAIFYVTSICNTITFLEIVLFVWVISWGCEEIRQIKDASKYTHLFGKPGTEDYLDKSESDVTLLIFDKSETVGFCCESVQKGIY